MRRIKNWDKLTNEGLVISLLQSESSDIERNHMKHFNNNNTDDHHHTYDGKIRGNIKDIRMMLSRLGNTVTNNDRKKITSKLYQKEKTKNLSNRKKK